MSKFGCKTTKIRTDKGLKLLILRPKRSPEEPQPGLLWIHGGGYATGMASMVQISRAKALVKKYGAVVISPAYRLAARHPYPAALEDCYEALRYLADHAAALGCDPRRLMVGGRERRRRPHRCSVYACPGSGRDPHRLAVPPVSHAG